ncbi:MAG: alpha/beta hydrolase [Hyphomicrobiaceae bacterium]|nr:alpha/beta hydrolase [Hyphomicrobiaceae bacterium]
MSPVRALSLAAAIALAPLASAWGQQESAKRASLSEQLRDIEVQEQLIALGVLDGTAGKVSNEDLHRAVAWFRRAFRFPAGTQPLSEAEKEKLRQTETEFIAATGLKPLTYKHAKTQTDIELLVPLKLVEGAPQAFGGDLPDGGWQEYRSSNGKVSVGPVVHLLSEYTPISLFRHNIMQASLNYRHLRLTSEEFAAEGFAEDNEGGYTSSNLVLTAGDKLKGVFIRYPMATPAGLALPSFLEPVAAAEPPAADGAKPDAANRAWQLLMQGVSNLAVGKFAVQNGWKEVNSKPCPLRPAEAAAGARKPIRILFGTDRKPKPGPQPSAGGTVDPDSLFLNEAGNSLHIGCAYVVPPVKDASGTVTTPGNVSMHRPLHATDKGNIGDQLFLTNEIAEAEGRVASKLRTRASYQRRALQRARAAGASSGNSALVFIHGYNYAFKDALFGAAQIASDIDYDGRVYVYSWPSAASTVRYIPDLDNAEQAEPFLQSFLKLLLRDTDIDYVDILVHSMGSQSVVRALSSLQGIFETERQGTSGPAKISIGQIIFAAPDVAQPTFEQKIRRIAPHANRVTVYASANDAALFASQLLRGGSPRMGEIGDNGEPRLVEVRNVHVIDATTPTPWWKLMFGYGHDYFEQNKDVQKDIRRILQASATAEYQMPNERSPDLFDKLPFKGKDSWFFWRLREQKAPEKK